MNKIALSSGVGAVLLLSVMTAPVALADDDAPSCDEAKRLVVRLEASVTDRAAKERVDEAKALDTAKADVRDTQAKLDDARQALKAALDAVPPVQATIDEARATVKKFEDRLVVVKALRDKAQKALDTDSNALAGLRARLEAAISDRDDACDDADPTSTPPTTTPAPEEPPAVDLDCGDFPLADGRTAQQVLDSTPGADPNGLDSDGDRVACEPGQDTASDEADGGNGVGSVAVPSGGVATGVGPE
jgi:hypothetical protein